jgi:cytochrome oxidase Cu insertion factor (SCO1/SenC/PrrC family)
VKVLRNLAVVAPLALLAAAPLQASPPSTLKGNVFAQPWAVSDFTLTDQHGARFRIADTKGKMVVTTYIYTHCARSLP